MNVGAEYLGGGHAKFTVWAPLAETVNVHTVTPEERIIPMEKSDYGYYSVEAGHIYPGTHYFFQLDEKDNLPDPASNYQVKDVHGPSMVVDHGSYRWNDFHWKGLDQNDLIIYELHVGTFTTEGTFKAIVPRLDELAELGVNAIEIMPIAQFSGNRNWGYDGVYLYSIHNTYGSVDDFKNLVDECHSRDIAVILDVVYNHLGPEGNYLSRFGPYFTNQYCTPWGDAVNFDGAYSDAVREFFIDNALFWMEKYHLDGLRLDATHMVFDNGPIHIWKYLSDQVQKKAKELGRKFHLIAENDTNGLKTLKPFEQGGFNFSAQWLDDFHHALYVLLDKKGKKYYQDFGNLHQLEKAYKEGYVHSGQYVKFRKRKHGISSAGVPGNRFVVFSQNHDQIGNRMLGERNTLLMSFDALKLSAAAVLLSPYIPMLFMGEEYAEESPFLYFVSHLDKKLTDLVKEGRAKDFERYNFEGNPPDPQAIETFHQSRLQWHLKDRGKHKVMWKWYKELIELRKKYKPLSNFDKHNLFVEIIGEQAVLLTRVLKNEQVRVYLNVSEKKLVINELKGWDKILDSSEEKWSEEKTSLEASKYGQIQPWGVLVLYKNIDG